MKRLKSPIALAIDDIKVSDIEPLQQEYRL